MESEKKVATWGGRLFSKEVEKLIDEDRIKEARQLWLDELENFLKSPETVGQIQIFFLFLLEELKKKYSIEERLRLGKNGEKCNAAAEAFLPVRVKKFFFAQLK